MGKSYNSERKLCPTDKITSFLFKQVKLASK